MSGRITLAIAVLFAAVLATAATASTTQAPAHVTVYLSIQGANVSDGGDVTVNGHVSNQSSQTLRFLTIANRWSFDGRKPRWKNVIETDNLQNAYWSNKNHDILTISEIKPHKRGWFQFTVKVPKREGTNRPNATLFCLQSNLVHVTPGPGAGWSIKSGMPCKEYIAP